MNQVQNTAKFSQHIHCSLFISVVSFKHQRLQSHTMHMPPNPQSWVCRTPSRIISQDNASSKCPPNSPFISLLPLLLSTCYPPLCLSHRGFVLLIPSEKRRQSRKSPLHLCHIGPRSLLFLVSVSWWLPSTITTTSSSTTRRCVSRSNFMYTSLPHFSLFFWDTIGWFDTYYTHTFTLVAPWIQLATDKPLTMHALTHTHIEPLPKYKYCI